MATDAIQQQSAVALAEARRAIDEHGVTDVAMRRIQLALRRLAESGSLPERGSLRTIHQSDATATVLASEGENGLTLVFASFPPEAPTPVHDHGTWGVAYVVEGHDKYIHWKRLDDGHDPEYARLEVAYERVLAPGESVYWFGPAGDIHHQQGDGETAWELVLFGKNAMRTERHYFDPATGKVTTARPQ